MIIGTLCSFTITFGYILTDLSRPRTTLIGKGCANFVNLHTIIQTLLFAFGVLDNLETKSMSLLYFHTRLEC